jgi:hypothetical protein
LAAALLACMALLCAGLAASESQRRIAVLTPDDELLRAISLSLSPWGVETLRSNAPPPAPSQPEAVRVTSRLARDLGVDAVVWVSSTEGGSLLWVFDARAGDVTTRMLAEIPPFDSAAAAAVALSVKTVLRSSAVAPPAERFGAQPDTTLAEHSSALAQRSSALEFGAGGQWVGPRQPELRFEIGGTVWVAAARRLGASLELSYGPGLGIDDALYRGTYREFIAGVKGRYRIIHWPTLWTAVSLGGAAHWTRLSGTLLDGSLERSVSRFKLSLEAEASMNVVVGHGAYIGASAGTSYLPRYERYLAEGTPVFSRSPFAASVGGHCGVELF